MSKKVKHDKHKPRKGRGRGASHGAAGAPIVSVVALEGAPAEQPVDQPAPQGTPQALKAPRAPAHLNGLDKAQKAKHDAVISSRNNTAQLGAKAGAQGRKIQGRRSGNR